MVLAVGVFGCAAAPVTGAWEHRGSGTYLRIALADEGKCVIVGGSAIGYNIRDGIGGRCRYSRAGDIISITHLGEIDGSGPLEALPIPLHFQLENKSTRLVALWGEGEVLTRLPR